MYTDTTYKPDYAGNWEVRQKMYTQQTVLTYNLNKCTGCGYCLKSCPKDALSGPEKKDGKIEFVKIDYKKCSLCGICAVICNHLDINALIMIQYQFGAEKSKGNEKAKA